MPPETGPGPAVFARLLLAPAADAPLPETVRWEDLRPGVEIARLYGDADSGPSAAYLRYAPGARVPLHRHRGYEHIFVLQGEQTDDHGSYGRGSCLIHAPGSRHAVHSDGGCLVLAVWSQPVEFV